VPAPTVFEEVPAETYDQSGSRVGHAELRIERHDETVDLIIAAGIDGAERSNVRAEFAWLEGGAALRPLRQESESHDAAGRSLGVMTIDHTEREGRCAPPPGESGETARLELPDPDRVANVAVPLLVLPLVRGETQRVPFQVMLCRGGPRLVDAVATLAADGAGGASGRHWVEVRYALDFGALSSLAAPFLPRFSLWYDPAQPGGWMAHTQTLFSKGPTVLVVRTGVAPPELTSP
jgi:hypothetical protein